MRLLRSWHEETGLGDITHELLKPDQPFYGFTQLNARQQAAMDRTLGVEYTTHYAASAA